jgi:hypothetical protein
MYAKADRDEKVVLISYDRQPEASVNAVTALKAAWNQLRCDREGCGDRTTRPVEAGRLVDLRKRSRRNQLLTLKMIPDHAWIVATYGPR